MTDLVIFLTGLIGSILILTGRIGVAYRRKWGFLSAVVGGITVGYQAVLMANYSVAVMCAVLVIVDVRGWFYWRKTE